MKKLLIFFFILSWFSCDKNNSCYTCTYEAYVDNGGGYKLINKENFDTCGIGPDESWLIEEGGTYDSGKYKYVTECERR